VNLQRLEIGGGDFGPSGFRLAGTGVTNFSVSYSATTLSLCPAVRGSVAWSLESSAVEAGLNPLHGIAMSCGSHFVPELFWQLGLLS
jgi:hypothetical protein